MPPVLGAAVRQRLVEKGTIPANEQVTVLQSRLFTSQFKPDDNKLARLAADRGLDAAQLRKIRTMHASTAGALTSLLTPPSWAIISGSCDVHRPDELVCLACERPTTQCEWCLADVVVLREKGVDMRLGVDLVDLAWHQRLAVAQEATGVATPHPLDIAIVVSSDADLVPAVLNATKKGVIVVNAAWRTNTGRLPQACTASFYLDDHISTLTLTVPEAASGDEHGAAAVGVPAAG